MASKITQQVFQERVKEMYPDLDFTETVYTNSTCMLSFTCRVHGEQSVRADKILQGKGCPKCGRVRAAEKTLVPRIKALTPEQKAKMAARARAGRTEESNAKVAESQRQRWATDEAGKAAQAERGKRSAAQMWANLSPEERKAKMAAVRAAKRQ